MINSILIYILSFVVLVLIIWIIYTERRFKKFFAGTKAKDLEEVMTTINKQMEELTSLQIKINKHLSIVDKRLDQGIRNIETVRFNPFGDAGSNQSFAMSFLNDEGNGVVVSSLYARDRMSIFAKPIKNGKSDFDLSIEEKEVLNRSIKK